MSGRAWPMLLPECRGLGHEKLVTLFGYVSFRSCDVLGNVWSVKPRDRSVSRVALRISALVLRCQISCERWGRTCGMCGRGA